MILQALTKLYEDLVDLGQVSPLGWSKQKISFALCLKDDGSLFQVIPQSVEEKIGKKTVLSPQKMELPAAVTRSSGILPNFLWDNSSYLLGVDDKGKPKRSIECFNACAKLHHQLLDNVDSTAAKALLSYFDNWNPENAGEHPALKDCWNDLMKGANLIFRIDGQYAHEDKQIQAAWDRYYCQNEGETAQCLVTGKQDIPESVHPTIKGVLGAQSSGAAIVSFNAPAFCSYGKEQSLNAPVGKYAAFAYTSALNHLLADRDNVQRIGETTIVCWAEGAESVYQDLTFETIFGGNKLTQITTDTLQSTVKRLAQGLYCEELNLDPKRAFYILGLSPNAARLSVRFFYRSSFGEVMKNINDHHERMKIAGKTNSIPLWAMLRETENQKSKDKSQNPAMAGAVIRAVFSGTNYPASLLEATMLRIRAERDITPGRAAILKAYYLKNYLTNPNTQCPEEVLQVSLNENSTNIPYTLGRLFAVYEIVQGKANPGINATIKDKYFNSAAATPATIFPILDNLCAKHLRKLKIDSRIYYDKLITGLKNVLGEENPTRLTLAEQGSFYLGYYHQKQPSYNKKEEQ